MKLNIRNTCGYKGVTLRHDDVTIDVGLMDSHETLEFAKMLKTAIWELLEEDVYTELMEEDE